MKNRYEDNLRLHNLQILELCPAHFTSRTILALELKEIEKEGLRVLEIGCGEGDSAIPILLNTNLHLDLSDISEEMIQKCKQGLDSYKDRISFICKDGLSYLKACDQYDVIFSEWTIHNFNWDEKRELFGAIYNKLNQGGYFLLMDKVYPEEGAKKLFDNQMKRYEYLDPKARDEIVKHESDDYLPEFRMDEKETIEELKKAGFSNIFIVDRLERDIVLIAKKKYAIY
jgi:SAM-dependent methyltransferase